MSGVSLKAAEATFAQLSFGQKVRLTTAMLKEQALAWLATPMGMATVAVTSISLLISGFKAWKQNIQETRQELMQLGQQAADTNKQLYDLISQYSKLGKDGQIDLSDQETAKGIQEQIVELVGDQAKNIDLVNGKYDEEIEKLQQIKALGVGDSYNDISRAAKSAEANLRDGYTDKGFDGSAAHTIMGGSYQTKSESEAIKKVMTENGFEDFISETQGVYKFKADTTSPEKMVESYYKAVELASVIARDYGEDIENSEGALYDFYNNLNKFIDNNKEDVEAYSAAIKNLHTMDANADLAEYLKTNDINSQDAFDSYIEGIKNSTEYSDAYKQVLIDVANDAFPQFSNSAKDAGENANKMTVSLSEMRTASDNLSALSSAFKQLSDDGYMSTESMSKIQEATKLSGDEWDKYQNKLMNAKAGSAEFNQVMSELTYKILDNEFATIDLTNATDEEILAIENKIAAALRENGVVNANAVAHDYLAISKANEALASYDGTDASYEHAASLLSECGSAEIAQQGMANLKQAHDIFNNTNLDISQKIAALQQLGQYANWTAQQISSIVNTTLTYSDGKWWVNSYGEDADNNGELDYLGSEEYHGFDFKPTDYTVPRYSSGSSKGGGSSSSDKNEALDNYLKYAESLYKVHQDEAKYINDLQWASDNLTKNDEERLELAEKISEAYRDLADNRIKDIEHQNELLLNQGKTEYDLIENYKKLQDIASEEANRYREEMRKTLSAMGYEDADGVFHPTYTAEEIANLIENSDYIQELQNIWWDNRNKEVDARFANSQDWIDERNRLNDWHLFGDSEVEAWERVVKWLKEEYPEAIDEIKEAEENLFEARKEQFSKATDFASSYFDSQKTLLQSHYDVTNSIAEAQHEINKELEASKTMYEYLDEDTRKLLFNQEDYNKLSQELNEIQDKSLRLKADYEEALDNATLDTIEEITSNYEMQYETLMKSYEIAKADLEVAKKKQKLNNVLNERNVRMLINGQWQWVANTQDVIDAQGELADAEYEAKQARLGKKQADSLNNLTAQQGELTTVINKFESGVIDLDTAVDKVKNMFNDLPSAIMGSLEKASTSSSTSKNSSGGSSGRYGKHGGVGYDREADYMSKILNASNKQAVIDYNEARNAKIDGEGLASDEIKPMTNSQAIDEWKKAKGHASGTRYTPGGMTLLGEVEPEMYITNNGRLIPINQPTIGNLGAGGVVFNQAQMANLRSMWDLSNIGASTLPNVVSNNKSRDNVINYILNGDVHIDECNNADDLLNAIADRFRVKQ